MSERIGISDLVAARDQGRKIVAVSCYDFTTASLVARADVDMVLVGDSAAQVMLGYDSTLPATMDFMVAITAAVGRGAPRACLVADMPFLSCSTGIYDAVRNAGRFVQEAGAQLIKIESSVAQLDVIKAVSDAHMAVMAHIGIRPQSVAKLGKLKAQGTSAEQAFELIDLAEKMVRAGASCLLLEGTAREVAKIITRTVTVPVISCGSGPDCDGQILIISDILGENLGPMPRFSKNYASLAQLVTDAVQDYATDVREGNFPDDDHSYHVKSGELERLGEMLDTPGE